MHRLRPLGPSKAGASKTMEEDVKGGGMAERLLGGLLGDEQEARDAKPTGTL